MAYPLEAAELAQYYGITIPQADQPGIFLTEVWKSLPDEGLIGLVADEKYLSREGVLKGSTDSDYYWANDRENYDFYGWAYERNNSPRHIANHTGNIYWNGASRKAALISVDRPEKRRGGSSDLVAVGSLWADLDMIKSGAALRDGVEAALALPLPPTFIVFSGGGLQVIHCLAEGWLIPNPAEAHLFKQYSLSFYRSILSQKWLEPDTSVHEATRMMRLPGFINRKKDRGNAAACIIYYDPSARYTLDQIKTLSPLPERSQRETNDQPLPDEPGVYPVTKEFIRYMVNAESPEGNRHPLMRWLAQIAYHGGIPQNDFEKRLYKVAEVWYADDPGRLSEVSQVTDWAYNNPISDWEKGNWLVRLTDEGFQRVIDEQYEKKPRSRVVEIAPLPTVESMAVDPLRQAVAEAVRGYLGLPVRRIGTMQLLGVSPGVGKTYITLNEIAAHIAEDPLDRRALYLSQFKLDWQTGKQWAAENNLDYDQLGFYIARNPDPASPGYCEYTEQANALGAKNHNVYETLCTHCPLLAQCQKEGYLSQQERLKDKPILVARFQHGYMESILEGRRYVIIDESPLDMIAGRLTILLGDMRLYAVEPFVKQNYPAELDTLRAGLEVLRAVVASNESQSGPYPTLDNIKLGGYWLINRMIQRLGVECFEEFIRLPSAVLENVNRPEAGAAPEDLAKAVPAYLKLFMEILSHEYRTYYQPGRKAWNSRLIPFNHELHIYPMTPLSFTAATKVIVLDATGLPELYPLAFVDRHTENGKAAPRGRKMYRFDTPVTPAGRVVQWTGTENSKQNVMKKAKAAKVAVNDLVSLEGQITKIRYTLADTIALADQLRDAGAYGLAQLMIITHELAIKEGGDLLVITYKNLVGAEGAQDEADQAFFSRWLDRAGILHDNLVQWFGNLRGKNHWKKCRAVLVAGTPRMQEVDLLALAQAFYWNDPDPIDTERVELTEPYRGYSDEDGKGRGYKHLGYRDNRVNTLYLHSIQAELRQCYERIRPNTEPGQKTVYLATGFPCADHVDEMRYWESDYIRLGVNAYLEASRGPGFKEATLIQDIAKMYDCDKRTAKAAYRKEYDEGRSLVDRQKWVDVLPLESPGTRYHRGRQKPPANIALNKTEFVKHWLAHNPGRGDSVRGILREIQKDFPEMKLSASTVAAAMGNSDSSNPPEPFAL